MAASLSSFFHVVKLFEPLKTLTAQRRRALARSDPSRGVLRRQGLLQHQLGSAPLQQLQQELLVLVVVLVALMYTCNGLLLAFMEQPLILCRPICSLIHSVAAQTPAWAGPHVLKGCPMEQSG